MQSLDDAALRAFGRDHDVNEAMTAIETAKTLFSNISLDFIYGRSGQSVEEWEKELCRILSLEAQHLSLYQLTLERGTPLFKEARKGHLLLPDNDMAAKFYDTTVLTIKNNGYSQYEVSSFALGSSNRYHSRHNLGYWKGNDYMGIGPGAHGRITLNEGRKLRTFRILEPQRWMTACDEHGHGLLKADALNFLQFSKVYL